MLSKLAVIFVVTLTATRIHIIFLFLFSLLGTAFAQELPVLSNQGGRFMGQMGSGGIGRGMMRGMNASGSGKDSLKRRDQLEDSITISYRYLNQPVTYLLDSTVGDFTTRFPLKATTLNLGNLGGAARSLLFSPSFQPGFDAGFHSYDVYKWNVDQVPFFQTTRPYTELQYSLGSRIEQIIGLQHTQNINARWNFSFHYRMINSPGIFQHQRTNHNNFLFTSKYQSKNLRYHSWFISLSNKLQSEENGGIKNAAQVLDDPIFKDRFNIAVNLGGADYFSSNFFSTKIKTGTQIRHSVLLWRNQYDLGKRDSLVTDSTVIPLFFPRFRLEHQLRFDREQNAFIDKVPGSDYYQTFYQRTIAPGDSVDLRDKWNRITNEFSIYQFPDAKNLKQYIKAGIGIELLNGFTAGHSRSFFNSRGQFAYRNITRNKKWDLSLDGVLFLAGFNAGDYLAAARLQRSFGKNNNSISFSGSNVNRTPSFVFDSRSSFYLSSRSVNFKKENNTNLSASVELPAWGVSLTGAYFLMTNYTYFTKFYEPQQESSLFTLFQVSALKTFRIAKKWRWHAEVYWQQRIGSAQLNAIPLYLRNRIAYEGNLGFKNLNLATGLEIRYRAPYKADNYSPLLGQFFYQDSLTISNVLPDISYYLNFRIRPFTAFLRFENLNTARDLDGFGFTRNNWVAPGYVLNGLHMRLGIYWRFVN